ncbi:Transcription factor 25 [Acipenser ruthenus]|uniref:Transcription factor 25 n=1 Tax=Acipenser ruthenus TaxID=7906 RepID=A0A444U326_ACIRT|nr:Transcription factor 25 [Acipenser ruthenus]
MSSRALRRLKGNPRGQEALQAGDPELETGEEEEETQTEPAKNTSRKAKKNKKQKNICNIYELINEAENETDKNCEVEAPAEEEHVESKLDPDNQEKEEKSDNEETEKQEETREIEKSSVSVKASKKKKKKKNKKTTAGDAQEEGCTDDIDSILETIENQNGLSYRNECSRNADTRPILYVEHSLTSGTSRLDYLRPENRAFYLSLYKHMMFLEKRGCPRTALEYCKLILSLDPDNDPLCMLLLLDFLSLRSREYSFLSRIYEEWEAHRNLSQLPNFAYSVGLCYYFLSQQEDLPASECTQKQQTADHLLQNALLMFPSVLMPLLEICAVEPDAAVSSHAFFGPRTQIGQPPALNELVALFVGRSHSLWKDPAVMLWLERNVKEVLQRVDANDPVVEEYEKKANRVATDESTLSLFLRSLLPNFNLQGGVRPEEDLEVAHAGRQLNQEVNRLMGAMRDMLANIQFQEPPREDNPERDEEEWD